MSQALYKMASLVLTVDRPPDETWDDFPRFIPRLSMRDGHLLDELPTGALAKPLLQASRDRQLVLDAHQRSERRVVLELEAWRNQVARRERHREFNALGEPSLRGRLDPATLRSSSQHELARYSEAFLLAAEVRGSDMVLLPSHLAGGHGEADREGELRLATVGARLVRQHGLGERGQRRKPLVVGVTLDVRRLTTPAAAVALARSYAALDGDGYWVQLAHLTEASSADSVAVAARFLFALQAVSARRVYAVDCKNLMLALLAGGLWGTCVGVGEREQFDGPDAASTTRRAIRPAALHRALLRNFQVDGASARAAFREFPCGCGVHLASEPPNGKPDIRRHTMRLRLEMTGDASSAGGVAAVRTAVREAGWAAADLGLEQPPVAAYEAVFAATDWRSVAAL